MESPGGPPSKWVKAVYEFHSFAYRDPRSAFSSAPGLPVVSPTTVLLGIVSTLFEIGEVDGAREFLNSIHTARVVIDSPNGALFFRAFHQLRRYETDKYDKLNPRLGLTNINQGTREYALFDGPMTIFVGVAPIHLEFVKIALTNRDHLGTHDSLCALLGEVEECDEPTDVVYQAPEQSFPMEGTTIVSLSRFRDQALLPATSHWWMSGPKDAEIVPYVIKGRFSGTSRGKIYRKERTESPE